MADSDWKKRIGIEINYNSDSEDSDEETGNSDENDSRHRRESVDLSINSNEGGMEGLHFDEILNEYADYGSTPPRTRISNKEKLRKWRDKDDFGEVKVVPKTVHARKFESLKPSFKMSPNLNSINRCDSEQIKMDQDRRKRCMKLLRESQRDLKLDLINLPTNSSTFIEHVDDRAESLPVIKVETSNRFMSLTSKLVATHQSERGQTLLTLSAAKPETEKILPVETSSNERAAFHRTFSHLIRYGNAEVIDKTSRRQLSREEHLWQSELKDLIWLELQAWHADRTPTQQDQFVCQERTKIGVLLDEIMNYRFVRRSGKELKIKKGSSFLSEESHVERINRDTCAAAVVSPAVDGSRENTLTSQDFSHDKSNVNGIDGIVKGNRKGLDGSNNFRSQSIREADEKTVSEGKNEIHDQAEEGVEYEDCPGCYSMYCKVCLANQNAALAEVESFLQRLGHAESLYPSSKAFSLDYPLYLSQEFIMRIKAMCLWYNMTRNHLLKIIILGKLLLQYKFKKHFWPLDFRDGSNTPNDAENSPWTTSSSTQSCPANQNEMTSSGISSSSSCVESTNGSTTPQSSGELHDDFDREQREMMNAMYRSEYNRNMGCSNRRISRVTFALDCFEGSASDSNRSDVSNLSICSQNGGEINEETRDVSSQIIYSASMSMLSDERITKNKGENGLDISPYQLYIERMLKTKGLRKALHFIENLHRLLLCKSRISLQRPQDSGKNSKCPILDGRVSPTIDGTSAMSEQEMKELQRHGFWCPEAQETGLPSYCSAFLFICRIPLDVIQAYLQIRYEQKPKKPSDLSIRQLMREFREGIQIAVLQRQRYLHCVRTALWNADPEILREFEDGVAEFDQSMRNILEAYLEYLKQWVSMVQQESLLISTYQKNLLEEEWSFVKATCPHIPGGEALAANMFCLLATDMLKTIGKYLNSEIDDLIQSMGDIWPPEDTTKHVMLATCRSLQSIFIEARERALKGISFAKTLRKDLEIAAAFSLNSNPRKFLKRLQETGHVRVVAPHSCKHLIFIPGSIRHCPEHIRKLVNMNCSVGDCWTVNSKANSGRVDGKVGLASVGVEVSSPTNSQPPCGVYLLVIQGDGECKISDEWHWEGETVNLHPTAETTITLSHVEVDGVLLIASDPCQLTAHRKYFMETMGDIVNVECEHRPSNSLIAESLTKLKTEALSLSNCVTDIINLVEEKSVVENLVDLDESERQSVILRCREILHQCYKFGFEYQKELSRLVTGKARNKLSQGMIAFAQQWMNFVLQRCERGRGLRPRWAQHGLEFLSTICDPRHTQCICDEEFKDLKHNIEQCISHVIGSALERSPSSSSSLAQSVNLLPSPASSRPTSPRPVRRIYSATEPRSGAVSPSPGQKPYRSSRSVQDMTPEEPVSPSSPRRRTTLPHVDGNGIISETLIVPNRAYYQDAASPRNNTPVVSRMERVRLAISKLDQQLEDGLREGELIGRVAIEAQRSTSDHIHIRSRSVNFNWQRGIKLGQGRFGKVYTAVNNRTGELMAMKEIQLHPNDHRTTIRSIAEELRIFEGIHHRHLVRYYGVEIHREEMLLFMEYCPEGTLEDLVATTEEATASGLPEPIIRRYTYQLLQAVATLHHHGIVHRDIKSANIFLADEGNCLKLGDFGCAVKIKTHTTMPGELIGFVGTQAYMAPEVFMKTTLEGHGRAADIWSVGCVVVEMTSGKRPWHEFDSNYQIMFKVGMGEIPPWPSTLSQEGEDFLEQCLQHDTKKRATAEALLQHTFVKVEVDEEYQSIPLPSIYLKEDFGS